MNKLYAGLAAALLGAGLFVGGFFTGTHAIPTKTIETVKYIQLDPIHDSIPYPVVVRETAPVDVNRIIQQSILDGVFAELFPDRDISHPDTVYIDKTDTTKIMADWATKREYEETLFDLDTLGTMKLKTSVQYNRLGALVYDYTPVQKVITRDNYVIRKLTPYVGAGVSTFPSVNAEAGLFLNQSWGLAFEGNYHLKAGQYENMPKYDVGVKVLKMF